MLNNIIETKAQRFNCVQEAQEYVSHWDEQQYTLPMQSLKVTDQGKIYHAGQKLIKDLDYKLTDTALDQLNRIIKMPQTYAREIPPDLHAHNINAGFSNTMTTVTLLVRNSDHFNPEPCVVAILTSPPRGVPHSTVLDKLSNGLTSGMVKIDNGTMSIVMPDLVEDMITVLPADNIVLNAEIYNQLWVPQQYRGKASLDFSIKWTRLVCSNGAYMSQNIAKGSLMELPSLQRVSHFLDEGMEHIKAFKSDFLPKAVERMANTEISEQAFKKTSKLIKGTLTPTEQEKELGEIISVYDQMNLITHAAKSAKTGFKRRTMEVAGGKIIEGFLQPLALAA